MATMNISLPDGLKEWVERRSNSTDYSNASDYIRDLIRRDKETSAQREWFEAEVEKGYASGFTETTADDILKDMIAEAESAVRTRNPA